MLIYDPEPGGLLVSFLETVSDPRYSFSPVEDPASIGVGELLIVTGLDTEGELLAVHRAKFLNIPTLLILSSYTPKNFQFFNKVDFVGVISVDQRSKLIEAGLHPNKIAVIGSPVFDRLRQEVSNSSQSDGVGIFLSKQSDYLGQIENLLGSYKGNGNFWYSGITLALISDLNKNRLIVTDDTYLAICGVLLLKSVILFGGKAQELISKGIVLEGLTETLIQTVESSINYTQNFTPDQMNFLLLNYMPGCYDDNNYNRLQLLIDYCLTASSYLNKVALSMADGLAKSYPKLFDPLIEEKENLIAFLNRRDR